MATLTQTLTDEAIEVLADAFDKRVEIIHAADEADADVVFDDAEDELVDAPARDHRHGPRGPRQDLAARRDPRDRGRRGRGRWHHPAHRRLPGAPRRPHDHLPRHAGPRGLHGHARPRRQGHRHRGDRGGRRRRRHAADGRGDRPRQGGRGAGHGRGQQDRQGGGRPQPRARRAGPARAHPRRLGRRHRVRGRVREDAPEPRRPARDARHARRDPGAEGQPLRRGVRVRDRVAARPRARPGGHGAGAARAHGGQRRARGRRALGTGARDARLPRPARDRGHARACRSSCSGSTACPTRASSSASWTTSARPAARPRSARSASSARRSPGSPGGGCRSRTCWRAPSAASRSSTSWSSPTWPAPSRRWPTRSRAFRSSR